MSFSGDEKIFVGAKGLLGSPLDSESIFIIMEDKELLYRLHSDEFSCAFMFKNQSMSADAVHDVPGFSEATVHLVNEECFIVTNKGTDKGTGVLRLAERWGIHRDAILAVGNDANDIPMLEIAGVGVAVGNAGPEALKAADWIAPDVSKAGAAEAIRRFVL